MPETSTCTDGFRLRQATLRESLSFNGIGLHSGRDTAVTVRPAPPGHGIVFRRNHSRGGAQDLQADWTYGIESALCTTLQGPDGLRFRTVEHILGALYACQIDNALIEIDGEEVPILDGSALPLVNMIEEAGVAAASEPRRFIRVLKPVRIEDGVSTIEIVPADGFFIDFTLALPNIGLQRWQGRIKPETLKQSVMPSRTFGRLREAWPAILLGKLRLLPLLRGVSLDNALAIVGKGVLNKGGLRSPDEFVRHRVLDLIGDLALAGAPLLGRVRAVRTGHRLNLALLEKLMPERDAWESVTFPCETSSDH